MRIAQITPGMIEIPPKTWGAVEKIIWQYKLKLERLGHTVDIKYLDEVNEGDYDVVHIHMANLALMAYDKGLKYVFTLHDHHTYEYGKVSRLYQDNLRAMKLAELAIVPAEYLISYFEDVPVYLPHGVDLDMFKPDPSIVKSGLLCVGNNGLAGNSGIDRKGFLPAISASRMRHMPISIYGPRVVNEEFFAIHSDAVIDSVTLAYDKSNEELVKAYQKAKILIHATSIEAGHPPLTILEAMACGTPVIGSYMGKNVLYANCEIDRDNPISIAKAIEFVLENYEAVVNWYLLKSKQYAWELIVDRLNDLFYELRKPVEESIVKEAPVQKQESTMFSQSDDLYKKTKPLLIENLPTVNNINVTYLSGAKVEILGNKKVDYMVDFTADGNSIHKQSITNNMWVSPNRKWYTPWRIYVKGSDGSNEVYDFNITGKRALIVFDSCALGDTIAWIPYVEEFRKKYECKITLACFWDELFSSKYPEITFIPINSPIPMDTYVQYIINWQAGDLQHNPVDVRTLPLQQVATNVLGLEYVEMRPEIDMYPKTK